MKRQSKILSLVLTLALLACAFAVYAFAATDGMTVQSSISFSTLLDSWGGDATSSANPTVAADTGKNGTFQQGNRYGAVGVGTSYDGNKYAVITQNTRGANGNGPYFWVGTWGEGTLKEGVLTKSAYDISKYSAMIYEMDVMSPTAKFIDGANIQFSLRHFDEKGTMLITPSTVSNVFVTFGNDENGSFIKLFGSDVKYVNPYEFTRITSIYEPEITAEGIMEKMTVYINGELAAEKSALLSTTYYNDEFHLNVKEIRVGYTQAQDPTQTLAIDNVAYKTVAAGTALTHAEILASNENPIPFGVVLAEVDGVKYSDLAKAFEAVEEEGEITLYHDVLTPVVVDKVMTINVGEYEAEIVAAENFGLDKSTPGVIKVVDTRGQEAYVEWDGCYCEDEDHLDPDTGIPDPAYHPLYKLDESLGLYTVLSEYYDPYFVGTLGGGSVIYKLVGWTDIDGNPIAADRMVEIGDVNNGIYLIPVYEEAESIAFSYVKGGALRYVESGTMTLSEVMADADEGTTVTLFENVRLTASISVSKSLTLDMNGKTVDSCTTGTKFDTFRVSAGKTFNVMSSVAGAKFFSSAPSHGGCFITSNGENTTININGSDSDGNTTLSVYCATVVQAWQTACTLNIDGGEYYRTRLDNGGFVQLNKDHTVRIENALLWQLDGALIALNGRYATKGTPTTVEIDNCVLIGGNIADYSFKDMTMTFTNCYIGGRLVPTSVYAGQTAGSVTVGDGCYISGNVGINVVYAQGCNGYNIPSEETYTFKYNTYSITADAIDASSYVISEHVETVAYTLMVTSKTIDSIPVVWKDADGNEIGRSSALPGTSFSVPSTLKPITTVLEGWLGVVPTEWNEPLLIPVDFDGEEYVVTAKEGGATEIVATVQFLFNISTQNHNKINFYVPAEPDGVEITSYKIGTGERWGNSNTIKTTINGQSYWLACIWPGANGASTTSWTATLTFTYEGETYTVTSPAVTMAKYCNYILDTEDYSEEGKVVAVNVANYLYWAGKAAGGNPTALKSIVDNNTARIISIPLSEYTVPDVTEISPYVTTLEIYLAGGSPQFKLNLTELGRKAKISLSTGMANTSTYATDGYVMTSNTYIRTLNKTKITLTPEGSTAPITVTFTIANYATWLKSQGADATVDALLNALYGYVKAEAAYRNF